MFKRIDKEVLFGGIFGIVAIIGFVSQIMFDGLQLQV